MFCAYPRVGYGYQMAEESDENVLEHVIAGDLDQFAILVDRYQHKLYSFFFRSTGSRDGAAELAQETFVRAYRKADSFRSDAKFSTWLFRIARNLAIDESRKRKFRRHRSLEENVANRESGQLKTRIADSRAPDPERRTADRALKTQIAHAVECLPDDQREVFLLRQIQGLSFREIADLCDISENTAKSRMRYALEKLRSLLSDHARSQPPVDAANSAGSSSEGGSA